MSSSTASSGRSRQVTLLLLAACCAVTFCSCRAAVTPPAKPVPLAPPLAAGGPGVPSPTGTLPPEAWTGHPGDRFTIPGSIPAHMMPPMTPPVAYGPPRPYLVYGPWSPPGIAQPWPQDEYLHDGGDRAPVVRVDAEQQVHGLNLEDTVVHFRSPDGCEKVQPSNRVHIYAPRFAAVRKVENVFQNNQMTRVVGVDAPVGPVGQRDALLASTAMQPLQPISDISTKRASLFLDRQQAGSVERLLHPRSIQDALLPYENMEVIRTGALQQGDKPVLAESALAAITWTHDLGVQVAIKGQQANVLTTNESAQITYVVDLPGCPKLMVVKVASTQNARPGETVDFTIRFDNVGQQRMENVLIVDNLTTRLEYVPDSAQSSVEARFSTAVNEGESLVLRWELTKPLEVGQGGVVRFRCRVR